MPAAPAPSSFPPGLEPREPLRALDARRFRALARVAARVVTAPAADPVAIAHAADRSLARADAALQRELSFALDLLDTGLDGWLRGARRVPFARLSPDEQDRVLAAWRDSRLAPLRTAWTALRKLCLVSHYRRPVAWPAIGYPGPETPPVPPVELTPPAEPLRGFVDGARLTERVLRPAWCVVGSGAGGAIVAAVLAQAGREVLVLEEGPLQARAAFELDEDADYPRLYRDDGALATADQSIAILQGRSAGGSTTVNWATCFRTPGHVLEHWERHHRVRVREADLVPHWEEVEARLGIEVTPDEALGPGNRALLEGCRALGLQAAPTQRNVRRESGRDLKQSMLPTYLSDAVRAGAAVVTRCRVDRLEHRRGALRLHATLLGTDERTPTGETLVVEPRRLVLAAGAIHTPALLLRSGFEAKGLGERTWLHPVLAQLAIYPRPMEGWAGPPQGVASHQYARRQDMGFFLEAAPVLPMLGSMAAPGFGPAHFEQMRELRRAAAHIALHIDGFHRDEPGGRVRLRPGGAPRLDYPLVPRLWRALQESTRVLARIQLASGAEESRSAHDPPLVVRSEADLARVDALPWAPNRLTLFSAHVMGGCALGGPVDDEDFSLRGLPGVHVVDGSLLPTSLGVNPQVTIFGLARLAAHRLLALEGA